MVDLVRVKVVLGCMFGEPVFHQGQDLGQAVVLFEERVDRVHEQGDCLWLKFSVTQVGEGLYPLGDALLDCRTVGQCVHY